MEVVGVIFSKCSKRSEMPPVRRMIYSPSVYFEVESMMREILRMWVGCVNEIICFGPNAVAMSI